MIKIANIPTQSDLLKDQALLLMQAAQKLIVLKEIEEDLEQLQQILPHYLYYHACNSAALLLLYQKRLADPRRPLDMLSVIENETLRYDYWHKKLWQLKADGLTTQLSVLELNSELYHLLAAGFYMFYLARLPHLLHGSLRKHLRLRDQHCVLLGSICRSQMPEKITNALNHHIQTHAYLLDQLEARWQTSLKRIENSTGYLPGHPAKYRWIFEALMLTGGAVEMKFKNQDVKEAFIEGLGNIMGALVDVFHLRCQNLPDLENKKIWPISIA